MDTFLAISAGAILGANARYFLNLYCAKILGSSFPYGTMIINITGSFLLGFFLIWSTERVLLDPRYKLLIAIGFCGSYTTFSSFSFESIRLLQEGRTSAFVLNVVQSTVFSLASCFVGVTLARKV
jgi:CrcB protein